MTYDQLRDIIIERTTALTKCKYQNDINQKKLLEAQARIAELDSALDACLSGKRIPVAVTNRTDDLSALAAHDAEITSKYIHLLSDQNYEYNQKTNALIKRHVEQLVKVRKAALLEAQQAEISSFCMNYRMKCDEETKSLHIQIEAQQARIAELEAKLGAKPNWKIVLLPEKQNGQSKG